MAMQHCWLRALAVPVMLLVASVRLAGAGPVIIGGDDLTRHGFRSAGGMNQQGWLYIEKALTRMAQTGCITRVNDGGIAALGVTDSSVTTGGDAGAAIHYAAGALGIPVEYVEGATNIATYLSQVGTGVKQPAIIWIASNYDLTNDLDNAETAALAANVATLASFVNSGGGLMAHTEASYPGGNPWLAAIVPGLAEVPNQCNAIGASLTLAGFTAFPGLTNGDIDSTAGPCHSSFIGVPPSLSVLAFDGGAYNYIIGGGCNTTLGLDHFLCYRPHQFFDVKLLRLPAVDQFGAHGITLLRTGRFCSPTDKNGENPTAPSHPDHLREYEITVPQTTATLPLHGVKIVNQFGTSFVDVIEADRLLVPAAKSLTASPPPPAPPGVDHFLCYRVRKTKGTVLPTLPKTVEIEDQFGKRTLTLKGKRPTRLCAPVNKNDEDVTAPQHALHLLCYRGVVPVVSPPSIFINDQFFPQTLSDLSEKVELCVPSTKILPDSCGGTPPQCTGDCPGTYRTCVDAGGVGCVGGAPDGTLVPGFEECDDGNLVNADTCCNNCRVPPCQAGCACETCTCCSQDTCFNIECTPATELQDCGPGRFCYCF
jgi:hypothetical protein